MKEIWKLIDNYNNYEVSNKGRIRSLFRMRFNKIYKRIVILKQQMCTGYCQVILSKNSKQRIFLVHRLVANAFIKNIDNKPEVDHIDRNKMNNNVDNLEWVTRSENIKRIKNKKKSKKWMLNLFEIVGEEWRSIKDFELKYEISNYGRVRNIKKRKILKNFIRSFGYNTIIIGHKGKQIHRLVAESFIENYYNKPEVDHIDKNTGNNFVNNLMWCTRKENMNNQFINIC